MMPISHAAHMPFSLEYRTHQMFTGLGAGNIGDELMMLGFLKLIQPCEGSAIEVWDENSPAISWFPEKYHYLSWLDDGKCEQDVLSSRAVLLVGGTPVSHLVGLDWPLRALKKRLSFCHDNGIPVHAVGIGVDHLNDPEARNIFQDAFLPVKSWSVRSANCRRALMDSGVPENRIAIASDLAWLYEPVNDCTAWALSQWKLLGVDFNRPLIGVNVVSEVWGKNSALYKNIALALDCIAESHHAQIAFMCNEVREGEYFDHAAALSVMGMMKTPAIFLPNRYYHPDEMIGLLSHVDVSLSQRYHFTIQSVIAGTVPVSFARGEKLAVLIEELGMNPVGDMENVNPDTICRKITDALERRDYWRGHLLQMKKHLKLRAMNNGCFIKQLSAAPVQPRYLSRATEGSALVPSARLACVDELESVSFRAFMAMINGLAAQWGLRIFTDWSKVWEYPWIWFNALYRINWQGKHLVDLGSEISPMPWLIALLGAKVTLIETDAKWISTWEKLRDGLQVDIQWHIVADEVLPLADASVDVVTSFSVIEHQPDKIRVVNEIDRVLKPGGVLAISYDVCEPDRGMSFPEWNGAALTMREFETTFWLHPAFGNQRKPDWNVEDIPAFLTWHQQSAPHHRYIVGAAVLQKLSPEACCPVRFGSGRFDAASDASGCRHRSDKIGTVEIQIKPVILPERFLFIRPDTYGDMVLFEPVLRLLRRYKPDCEIFMLVRKGYPDIAPMISEDIHWLTVDANPYKMSPLECCDALKQLKLSLDIIEPGIIVAPLINKTWLEIVVASWYPKAGKVALGDVLLDVSTVDLLKKYLQIDIATIFTESIKIAADMTEWENNLLLASGLCHQSVSACIPQLQLSFEAEKQAEVILGEWKLLNKSWVACCPAGVSNVSIKKWPAEKYGQVIAWLKNEKNLDVCLLGHSNEQHILEAVREQSGRYGYRPLIWLGNDGQIPLLCSLLDKCAFYLGNDTGAMHMAGALNRPVAAIFGGGTWPRFKPAATRSIAVVQKLPCFGCNWMCHFSTAPCIRSIPVEKVIDVLSEWIDSGGIQERSEIDIQEFSDDSIKIIRQGAINIQDARIEQSDLRLQVAALTDMLKKSETDRNNRLEVINSIQKRLEEVEQERQKQVAELTKWLKESEIDRSNRLEVINSTQKRLEEVEQERRNQVAELTELYQALENTFVVRMARKLRLIGVRRPDDNPTC